MDLTIDQLAQRVAMTARNIREWQTLGLVPPPEKRGRVGIYSDDHVAIINHVKNLKSQGFPLDVIRRVIDSGGGSEDSVRKMVIEALSPFATGEPVVMPRAELITRVGTGADLALAELGLVSDVDAKTISVRDCETLDAIELLIAAGMSMSRIAETLREVDRLQHQIAQLLLGAYVADVWQPFVESGYASEDWGKIAENASKAKQLTVTLASRLLARALDDTVDPILLQQADEAEAVLERNRPASSAQSQSISPQPRSRPRTSIGHHTARDTSAAHCWASARVGTSMMLKPPSCSLVSVYGPSVVVCPEALALTMVAVAAGCRPAAKSHTPASCMRRVTACTSAPMVSKAASSGCTASGG